MIRIRALAASAVWLLVLSAAVPAARAQVSASPAKAGDIPSAEGKFYIGGGPLLAINHIDYNLDYEGEFVKLDDFDNSWGLDFKAGYFPIKYLAVEANFAYAHKFNSSMEWNIPPVTGDADFDVRVMTFTVNAKGYPLPEGMFRPYAIAGLGYGRAKADYTVKTRFLDFDLGSDTFTGAIFRIGAGIDLFLSEQFALELEAIYNRGSGDLSDIPITQVGANALIFF